MKIFPLFSNAVESTYLSAARDYDGHAAVLGARGLIDDAYIRINRAMWDSLKVIARESPTAAGAAASATTAHGLEYEDKEILNYHILLIENMNHYIEEVDDGGKEGSVLAEWKAKALMDRAEHMEEYVGRVVRRPLGKIIVSFPLQPPSHHHITNTSLTGFHRRRRNPPQPKPHRPQYSLPPPLLTPQHQKTTRLP